MTEYCTIEDVILQIPDFRRHLSPALSAPDVQINPGTLTIPQDTVTAMIKTATSIVKSMCAPNYDFAELEKYDPDLPAVVVQITAYKAAVAMLGAYPILNTELMKQKIDNLKREIKDNSNPILGGTLYFPNGDRVTRRTQSGVIASTSTENAALQQYSTLSDPDNREY